MKKLLALAAMIVLATACGGGGGDSTKPVKVDGTVQCSALKTGTPVLASQLDGCTHGDTVEAALTWDCAGSRKFVVVGDLAYGFTGGKWQAGATGTPAYDKVFAGCNP